MPETRPAELRVRLNAFGPIALREGEAVGIQVGVLPGTDWTVVARGPGVLTYGALEEAFNRQLRETVGVGNFMQLRGSTGTFEYSCQANAFTRGEIRITRDYVDATGFGDPYARQLPVTEDPVTYQRNLSRLYDDAERRSHETLHRLLSEQQRTDLKEQNYFFLTGNLGTRYRLRADGYSGNVWWVDEKGKPRGNFCAHPEMTGTDLKGNSGRLPIADAVIAQMLMLKTDELAFLKMANLFGGTYPPVVTQDPTLRDRFPDRPEAAALPGCECRHCQAAREMEVCPG